MMQKLHIEPSAYTPGIDFNPESALLSIKGNSSPEDVRSLYYPVIDWLREFHKEITEKKYTYSKSNPLIMRIDLGYFNSSSAKFLFDIINEMKKIKEAGSRIAIEWVYEKEDLDMKEAGNDIALLLKMEFQYVVRVEKEG